MTKGQFKGLIQSAFNRFGLQIRSVDPDVSYIDPYIEQVRLLQNRRVETVFEIGAYDGRDTMRYASLFPHAQVHSFEPVPESFAKLQAATQCEQRISVVNAAMSDTVGTAVFNLAEWIDASSLLPANRTNSTFDDYSNQGDKIQVQTMTIDAYCQEYQVERIDLLKMDAQGAEYSILQGAKTMLQSGKIGLIFTEVNFMDLYQGAKPYDAIASHLRDQGFRLHNLYGLISNQKGQLAWGDAIFIREDWID
jgi:FkbM family methyltransferase